MVVHIFICFGQFWDCRQTTCLLRPICMWFIVQCIPLLSAKLGCWATVLICLVVWLFTLSSGCLLPAVLPVNSDSSRVVSHASYKKLYSRFLKFDIEHSRRQLRCLTKTLQLFAEIVLFSFDGCRPLCSYLILWRKFEISNKMSSNGHSRQWMTGVLVKRTEVC